MSGRERGLVGGGLKDGYLIEGDQLERLFFRVSPIQLATGIAATAPKDSGHFKTSKAYCHNAACGHFDTTKLKKTS